MGVVYLAHDTKLDRLVAIKNRPAEVMDNPKGRSRFAREARVLASLNHPNIATIFEQLEQAESTGYLVLEYVPGQTLAERIAKAGLELNEVLSIALQIAEAVAVAHEQDVIHRDLKPGNIKITPEGKVKVLDFGLAKALGDKMMLICFFDMLQRPSRYCVTQLAKQAEELKQKDVTVVAVQASKIEKKDIDTWIKKNSIPFPVGMAQGDETKTRLTWGIRSLPWLILTDKEHVMRAEGFSISELGKELELITGTN